MKRKIFILFAAVLAVLCMTLPAFAEEVETASDAEVAQDYETVMDDLKQLYPERYEAIEKYVHQINDKLREQEQGWMTAVANWGDAHMDLICVCILGAALIISVVLKERFKRGAGAQLSAQLRAAETSNNNAVDVMNEQTKQLEKERKTLLETIERSDKAAIETMTALVKSAKEDSEELRGIMDLSVKRVEDTVHQDDERWAKNIATMAAVAEVLNVIAGELRIPQRRKDEIMQQVEGMRKAVGDELVEKDPCDL